MRDRRRICSPIDSPMQPTRCLPPPLRIYNTPIPLAYSRHTSRFLVIYVSTLPLVLVAALRCGACRLPPCGMQAATLRG